MKKPKHPPFVFEVNDLVKFDLTDIYGFRTGELVGRITRRYKKFASRLYPAYNAYDIKCQNKDDFNTGDKYGKIPEKLITIISPQNAKDLTLPQENIKGCEVEIELI